MAINLTLRARIFFSMLLVVALSFILTGAISVYHFWQENEEYHEKRLKRKETTINASIDYFLGNYPNVTNDSLSTLLDNKICEWADINNMDINIYGLEGELLITSNVLLVEEGIVTSQIDSEFVRDILRQESLVLKNELDTTIVLSSFKVIYDNTAHPLAIVNLPYFEEAKIPLQDIEFLETLIGLYIVLFFIAVIVAYFLSNYITGSLKTIGERITKTKINKENKPLEWDSHDEIGQLVEEYNRMLKELEENAVILARSERESAWKEMAKQVAHEIKNPLTPMRLMVQHLALSLKTEDEEQLKEFTSSMIEQIDTMTSIADAFSRFADMPELNLAEVNMNELVESASRIYKHLDVDVNCPPHKVVFQADKNQLLRVLNNLIKNGWQSVPEDREPKLQVNLKDLGDKILLEVRDNGAGIEEAKKDKIFEPSFTTKTQGMGLGLSMVNNIIESMNGIIEVKSEVGKGTSFFITLPKS